MVLLLAAIMAWSLGGLNNIDPRIQYVFTGILFLLILEIWRRNRNLPPGPWSIPFIGYYPFLDTELSEVLKGLSRKYGDLVSFRTLGGHLVIILNGLPLIKEVIVTRSDEFTGKPLQANLMKWIDGGQGISQSEGFVWKEQKRFFLKAAKNYGFGQTDIEPLIHELLHSMISDIRKLNGASFDPLIHITHISCNVISSILFNKRFDKNDAEFLKMAEGLHHLLSFFTGTRIFLVGSPLKWLMNIVPSGRKAQNTKYYMTDIVKGIVDEHRRNFNKNNQKDFIDSYLDHISKLETQNILSKSSFSMERLYAIALNMLMEGTESVCAAILCLLDGLSHHVDVQCTAQMQLDTVVGHERLPSWNDRQNLPYIEALILELFRTTGPFPTSLYYSNFRETYIRNYRIPERSVIVVNFSSVSNDSELFSQPLKFDPSRFLGPDGKRIKHELPIHFGIGKRSCTGEALAQMEVFIVIASVLQNFTLYPSLVQGQIKAVPRDLSR